MKKCKTGFPPNIAEKIEITKLITNISKNIKTDLKKCLLKSFFKDIKQELQIT